MKSCLLNYLPSSKLSSVVLMSLLIAGSTQATFGNNISLAINLGVYSVGQQQIAPEKIVGREECKKCHQSEFNAWAASAHGTNAWNLLSHPKAPDIAKKMSISAAEIKTSLCTGCHGTAQKKAGTLTFAQGNSCESCHGGAGGDGGWLKTHSDFGTGSATMAELLKDRLKESPEALAKRQQACKAAGMNRSEDLVAVAKNCLQCHIVPNEQLIAAGHPTTDKFEFVEWAQGEVRHNFLLNAAANAEVSSIWMSRNAKRSELGRKGLMFISGQLADLEVSLRTRANVTSTKRNSLGDAVNDRILDSIKELEKIKLASLQPVIEAIENGKIDKKTVKEITPNDKQLYTETADAVQAAAAAFVKAHQDGNGLPDIKLPRKVKGDVHDGS